MFGLWFRPGIGAPQGCRLGFCFLEVAVSGLQFRGSQLQASLSIGVTAARIPAAKALERVAKPMKLTYSNIVLGVSFLGSGIVCPRKNPILYPTYRIYRLPMWPLPPTLLHDCSETENLRYSSRALEPSMALKLLRVL